MRNAFLSNKLKQIKTRLLIIDDNQIRYNQIVDLLTAKGHQVDAFLLDDIKSFEKQLHTHWDVVLFGRAYDLKVEQALALIHASNQPHLPLLLLNPEDYNPSHYLNYINKGVYDLFNLDYPDRFYIGLVRTLSYSRALQAQQHLAKELEIAETHIQTYAHDTHKALAVIQEGIHIKANAEYLALFGFQKEEDIFGLPLLDVLQPDQLQDFKQRFKRVTQRNFDQARFEIKSLNPDAQSKDNTLRIEFLPDNTQSDAVQISIETTNAQISPAKTNNEINSAPLRLYEQLNRKMLNEPANQNAMVLFRLADFNEQFANFNQLQTTDYLKAVQTFLQEQLHNTVIKVSPALFIGLCQAASDELLNSKLQGLTPLLKPQLLEVNSENHSVEFAIGYSEIVGSIENQDQFDYLITQGLSHPIQQKTTDHVNEIKFSGFESDDLPPVMALGAEIDRELSLLNELHRVLEQNAVHLKYQQLYDKQDTELYTYEVTSGVIYNKQWLALEDLNELSKDVELAIKLDRWVLVESCKQLYNFITQYPNAKLVINLNIHVLLHDSQIVSLIEKLFSIIRHTKNHPLILQFSAQDIIQYTDQVTPVLQQLRMQGALISVRHFGLDEHISTTLLARNDIDLYRLDSELTNHLSNDKQMEEFQQQIQDYQEIREIDMILPMLNNMNTFANAWNIDARYLQGDYFQKKLDHLIDGQDH
ncbi:EAL domain-containing protein [Acinetobacter sp. MB5]|uniref:EAL domain-containing protein n=1 Tax=Acinetobacter sp. MB5 TaxID=2069438 RepID=UPI000DCFC011|nr:EAL domain-containing protein [Acinetobacter sp. MB5]